MIEPVEDRCGVLAESGRGRGDSGRRGAERVRHGGICRIAQHGVARVLEEAAVAVLRRVVKIRGLVDRDQRDPQTLRLVGGALLGQVPDPCGEPPLKRGDLLRGDGELQPVVLEGVQPFRTTHEFLHTEPVSAAGHVQVDEAVGAGEKRRGARLVVIAAVAFGRDLPGDESAQDAVGAGDHHGMLGDVDELTPAGMQTPE